MMAKAACLGANRKATLHTAHLQCSQRKGLVLTPRGRQLKCAASASTAGESRNAASVCVLGAGVIGLTSALRIREAMPEVQVTIVAEKFGDQVIKGALGEDTCRSTSLAVFAL